MGEERKPSVSGGLRRGCRRGGGGGEGVRLTLFFEGAALPIGRLGEAG